VGPLVQISDVAVVDRAHDHVTAGLAVAPPVEDHLVSKGVDAGKVEVLGFGKTLPVKACPDQKDRKGLIACLADNRRVVVEVQGTPR
jgi:hypothetical protein